MQLPVDAGRRQAVGDVNHVDAVGRAVGDEHAPRGGIVGHDLRGSGRAAEVAAALLQFEGLRGEVGGREETQGGGKRREHDVLTGHRGRLRVATGECLSDDTEVPVR
mgnify:CR=1 FL=1